MDLEAQDGEPFRTDVNVSPTAADDFLFPSHRCVAAADDLGPADNQEFWKFHLFLFLLQITALPPLHRFAQSGEHSMHYGRNYLLS